MFAYCGKFKVSVLRAIILFVFSLVVSCHPSSEASLEQVTNEFRDKCAPYGSIEVLNNNLLVQVVATNVSSLEDEDELVKLCQKEFVDRIGDEKPITLRVFRDFVVLKDGSVFKDDYREIGFSGMWKNGVLLQKKQGLD